MMVDPAPKLEKHDRVSFWVVAISIFLVTALHYGTPRDPSLHVFHDVWRRLYYVPIILGAFNYGLRGGVLTALAVTGVYLPHVVFQWGGEAHGNQFLEIMMYNVIGWVTGLLAAQLRQRRREVAIAYEQLSASFERAKTVERMAAMGQLSAALSHEIRNPLASLKGSLPILLDVSQPEATRREFAEIVRHEIARLDELTTGFLEYARPPQPSWAEDSLNDLVDGVSSLVRKEAERLSVLIVKDLALDLPMIPMDSNRMRQVLLNLALNAIQAMPNGGRLDLITRYDDDRVELTVEDEGVGLSPEVREHLFEPFFTTKTEGTGLGLAVVYQWVQRHGGRIAVGSSRSGGASFRVMLPRRSDDVEARQADFELAANEPPSSKSDG